MVNALNFAAIVLVFRSFKLHCGKKVCNYKEHTSLCSLFTKILTAPDTPQIGGLLVFRLCLCK